MRRCRARGGLELGTVVFSGNGLLWLFGGGDVGGFGFAIADVAETWLLGCWLDRSQKCYQPPSLTCGAQLALATRNLSGLPVQAPSSPALPPRPEAFPFRKLRTAVFLLLVPLAAAAARPLLEPSRGEPEQREVGGGMATQTGVAASKVLILVGAGPLITAIVPIKHFLRLAATCCCFDP